jgi:cell wall-associated NlpC family hydrolase
MSQADLLELLRIPYRDHGRDRRGADCWGLVRLARHGLFGLPMLPSHDDVSPLDKGALHLRANGICADLERVEDPQPGDIMAGYLGRTMVHVGICVQADGRLWVLHTRPSSGPRLERIEVMRRAFTRIAWWRHAAD